MKIVKLIIQIWCLCYATIALGLTHFPFVNWKPAKVKTLNLWATWYSYANKKKPARGAWGRLLVPFRSIAVDPRYIPLGSLVYIPACDGLEFATPEGRFVHDGYFIAADTGGIVRNNQIDVYVGKNNINPFPWILSRKSARFIAHLVNDTKIRNFLVGLHKI